MLKTILTVKLIFNKYNLLFYTKFQSSKIYYESYVFIRFYSETNVKLFIEQKEINKKFTLTISQYSNYLTAEYKLYK